MQAITFRCLELFILFIGIPVSFVLGFPFWIKTIIGLVGFVYVVYVLLRIEKNRFKISKSLNWMQFWKRTFLKLIGIAVITMLYVWVFDSSNLFHVVINKPLLWGLILVAYSLFSVYPQELIYRLFFFQRYKMLFQNEALFLFFNATLFSLAHLFFRNALVMLITFLGGLLFALTYKKTKSTLLVTIEHAIYGCWLFTVGMGEMLGFPH